MITVLLPNQKISVTWKSNNKDYYISKGYSFTNYNEAFYVNAEDLYTKSTKKVLVVCDLCGKSYEVQYCHYYNNVNRNGKCICQGCSVDVRHQKELRIRQEKHYNHLIKICNEKNYELISSKYEIINNTTRIKYKCPIHGVKEMRIGNLLNGKGCPDCNCENARKKYQRSIERVILDVKQCGGEILNPNEYINQKTPNLQFVCSNCGEVFTTSLIRYIQHGGMVCSKCRAGESFGEKKIRYYLEKHNIDFIQQKWFSDCRDKKPLPFDFYIPNMNTLIEFDGEQHFHNRDDYFKHNIEFIKKHDSIKNQYCQKNSINLIRIPYTEINNIDVILTNKLFT